MQLKDLKPNVKNPRKISSSALSALKDSVEKYGDLSGFVYNRRSKTLVSGHQRQKTVPPNSKIVIEKKFEKPTAAMTVAEGYVQVGEERFKYREVDADERWETEALLAANKHGGEWDDDLLRVALAVPGLDHRLAGFSMPTLTMPEFAPLTPLDPLPSAEAESDEEYVKNTPQTTEQIPTESFGGDVFGEVKEVSEPVGKRYVLIIDCTSAEHKESLKDLIKEQVVKSGGKFF